MNIQIRKSTERDLPIVFNLVKEFALFLGEPSSVKTSIEDFRSNRNFFDCLLAETNDGEIIGYALFYYSFHTWSGKSIYLDDLYVKEEYRGCSVGTKLIHSLIEFAKNHNCKTLSWQVLDWNEKAKAFYKKMGASVGDDNLNCTYSIK